MWEALTKECNHLIWNHLYHGYNDQREMCGGEQHRDMIRLFFAGAFMQMIITGQLDLVAKLEQSFRSMMDEGWKPTPRYFPHTVHKII